MNRYRNKNKELWCTVGGHWVDAETALEAKNGKLLCPNLSHKHRFLRTRRYSRKRRVQPVVQTHHISYNPEVTVQLYRGEHWVITLIQRRKRFSQGFLEALDAERPRMEQAAVDLSNPSMIRMVKP